jgi:olefin beta-lactone synthetase
VVRGPIVTPRYYNRDAATKLAKIMDNNTGEILHRMGDVGYKDDTGRLWFCGRKSHRVVTPTRTYYTDMVEPIFVKSLHNISQRAALVGVKRDNVLYPIICIEMTWHDRWAAAVAIENLIPRLLEVADEQEATRGLQTIVAHLGPFPVDVRHNSKIFREMLAVWADRTLGPTWRGPTT